MPSYEPSSAPPRLSTQREVSGARGASGRAEDLRCAQGTCPQGPAALAPMDSGLAPGAATATGPPVPPAPAFQTAAAALAVRAPAARSPRPAAVRSAGVGCCRDALPRAGPGPWPLTPFLVLGLDPHTVAVAAPAAPAAPARLLGAQAGPRPSRFKEHGRLRTLAPFRAGGRGPRGAETAGAAGLSPGQLAQPRGACGHSRSRRSSRP